MLVHQHDVLTDLTQYTTAASDRSAREGGVCKARADLSWRSHPVTEDFGVQASKQHQANDPVCVAQSAAPQQ